MIFELLQARAPEASICPSEVVRALYSPHDWRSRMDDIRRIGMQMAEKGELVITQGGRAIRSYDFKGPYRFKLNR